MVSAGLTWFNATVSFFFNNQGQKVNGEQNRHHLKEEIIPSIKNVC